MIWLTRFDGTPILVNTDHVVLVEATADTVVVLDTGERVRVHETPKEIAARLAHWRLRIEAGGLPGDPEQD